MEYFVRTNLKHDGRAYGAGEVVDLPENIADGLLENGVIQTEPIEEKKPAKNLQRVVSSAKKNSGKKADVTQPEVGGEKTTTGEPSVDGQPEAATAEAEDITPKTEEAEAIDPSTNL